MDIALEGNTTPFDLRFSNGDLVTSSSLQEAVIISLFTDRRVAKEDLPEGETSRRGWWGDFGGEDRTGSRLWLLDRTKLTTETLALAREYCEEALAWLITDGLAERVDVATELVDGNVGIDVVVHLGEQAYKSQFVLNWRQN